MYIQCRDGFNVEIKVDFKGEILVRKRLRDCRKWRTNRFEQVDDSTSGTNVTINEKISTLVSTTCEPT